MSEMFAFFRQCGIMKADRIDTRNEIIYIDFKVFC